MDRDQAAVPARRRRAALNRPAGLVCTAGLVCAASFGCAAPPAATAADTAGLDGFGALGAADGGAAVGPDATQAVDALPRRFDASPGGDAGYGDAQAGPAVADVVPDASKVGDAAAETAVGADPTAAGPTDAAQDGDAAVLDDASGLSDAAPKVDATPKVDAAPKVDVASDAMADTASGVGLDAAGPDTQSGSDTKSGGADLGSTGGAPPADAGPCQKEGAESCGKPLGVAPDALYVCKAGKWKLFQVCQASCEAMPQGVPDRCLEDLAVPDSLVKTLSVKPYVEQACAPVTHPDWPYAAKKCTYTLGGKTATVITATPSAQKVGAWIVDSAAFVPALWSLRYVAPQAYKSGLQKIALAVLGQSSRIFPIAGGVLENMDGSGWVNYAFYHGVSVGCSSGCFCRINSLHRTEWCAYQAFLGDQTVSACLAQVGNSGLTKAWGDQCLDNHIEAWKSSYNHHFRAKARAVHKAVAAECATALACAPDKVLALIDKAL